METPGRHQQLLLGLDVGTQSLRAVLFDLQGRAVAFGVAPIETTYPRPTWAEQQPLAWWSAAVEAVRLALSQGNITGEQIAGIGIDCTACTVVAAGSNGEPLRPALLWMDQRAFQEAEIISATGDPVLRFVSGRVSPEWMLPKALWLKRNEPAVYAHAERIVECTDWMMHRLTGEWTLSLNHVAVKWNYARPDGGWPVNLLEAVGLSDLLDKWPERIVPLGRGEARLSSQAAGELGLRAGTPVAQGGIDAYLGMLGMGATCDGDVAVIVGSSTCHLAQIARKCLWLRGRRLLSRRDGGRALHARSRADRDWLDSRLVPASFCRQPAGRGPATGRSGLRGAGRACRGSAAGCGGTYRARRLAGKSFAVQEPHGARLHCRAVPRARTGPCGTRDL